MHPAGLDLARYIGGFAGSPLAAWPALPPWQLCARSAAIVRELLATLSAGAFEIDGEIAIHRTATVESGAVLKGPLIVGARCFIAGGAYLRGGNWLAEGCVIGPGSELKSSFLFPGSKLAHFNFVGDSLLGSDVNLEAGSIVCNHRNERADKALRARIDGTLQDIGCDKFGALLGDGVRIGANAVLAPACVLAPGTVIERAALCDQDPEPAG